MFRRGVAIDHRRGDNAGEAAQLTGVSAALLGKGDAAGALAAAREAVALADATDDIEAKARAHLAMAAALAKREPAQALAELELARPAPRQPAPRQSPPAQEHPGAAGLARRSGRRAEVSTISCVTSPPRAVYGFNSGHRTSGAALFEVSTP